jgi:hypothetical protein
MVMLESTLAAAVLTAVSNAGYMLLLLVNKDVAD